MRVENDTSSVVFGQEVEGHTTYGVLKHHKHPLCIFHYLNDSP